MIHVGGANSTDENKFELRTTLMYQCVHQTSHQAIWGAEDLGTILEYLAPQVETFRIGRVSTTRKW